MVYDVLNRGAGRENLIKKPSDDAAFENSVEAVLEKIPMRICGYCVMLNPWHFVLWPEHDGDLAGFMQRLTVTHVTRWLKPQGRIGQSHVDRGQFKSFTVETDEYFSQLVRYVERNTLRAILVERGKE